MSEIIGAKTLEANYLHLFPLYRPHFQKFLIIYLIKCKIDFKAFFLSYNKNRLYSISYQYLYVCFRYFMPFGVGTRSCMGVTTTFHRMFLFTTLLLQKHKLLAPSSGKLPSHDPRELTPGTVLQAPHFMCRVVAR